jgi:alkylresorcinol/alkylpyrone synthase
VAQHPRITALATAQPAYRYAQADLLEIIRQLLRQAPADAGAAEQGRSAEAWARVAELFAAARVHQRQFAVDLRDYYRLPRSTSARMADFQRLAPLLGRAALETALGQGIAPEEITDFIVVTCTGYAAPGLDVVLARDLGMRADVRRLCVGHMGCFGALVGLRQAHAAVRAQPGATAALLCVELPGLHFMPTDEEEVLTSFALFGDAAAVLVLRDDPAAAGPEIVDTACAADFAAAGQMTWTITDQGFVMGLSSRVPATLRRRIGPVVASLLARHGLTRNDITHWIVHPGGPSILEAVARALELSPAQMALSWDVLRDHGNCSSATVLLILERLLQSGQTRPREWGVMMAFGPGLTLETCLLRF